jgi:CHRD domain-containing protein
MKRLRILIFVIAAFSLTAAGSSHDDERRLRADLTGLEEVPVVNTFARGKFRATISNDEQSIKYRLSYSGLQGTVSQAHIHIAQPSVNGSIVIWLCQTAINPGPATHTCNPGSDDFTGTITADDVIAGATASQQLNAKDLASVIALIRAGAGYANVHTSPNSTGGEIRGQIEAVDRDEKRHDDDRDNKDEHQ